MILKLKITTLFVIISIAAVTINATNELIIPVIGNNNFEKSIKNPQNSKLDPSLSELITQVNTSLIEKYIYDIQSFGPHPTGSTAINEVKTYLFNEFSSMQAHVSYHPWNYEDKSGENIIATIKGKASSENIIITCAHYDTIEVSPGADDDGSGIAAVLMMASILSQYTFNSTIKFILFSGEEQGLLGSNEYVKELREQNANIVGVLALDKIGYAKTHEQGTTIRHHADPASSWMIDVTETISNEYKDEISLVINRLPFDGSSDHKAFVDQGYTGSNLVEHALNPYYHTSEDLLEHMNISYLKKVCQLATCTIATIAKGNSNLTNDDLDISVQGKNNNPYQAKLSIIIENKKYPLDTANLSITIEMNHILRDVPVEIKKEYYSIPCVWNFSEEIYQIWQFHLGKQTYSMGFFILTISVHGMYDDFPIALKYSTFGMIFPDYNLLIYPQLKNGGRFS